MVRLNIRVMGLVQGVGFRPFVHQLAMRLSLNGFVCNAGDSVRIEVEGEPDALNCFQRDLSAHAPAGSRIAEMVIEERPAEGNLGFFIAKSNDSPGSLNFAPADVATCPDCLAELFDPSDRRYRYPFISCARCGPRFTALTSLPYDRERTTMAVFPLCPACRGEYEDPSDRRFHAQTTACPECGPRLTLLDPHGNALAELNAIAAAVAALRRGQIVAVKGIGGFHLACDAGTAAVGELRRRKHRDEKPLAVMVADLEAAHALCEIAPEEAKLLASPVRPIVLMKRRPVLSLAENVADGTPLLGVMLAYTPLHILLLHDFAGPLVMTSGNRSDEPMACDDADALRRLAGIADLFLTHDRAIRSRCDDSVTRVVAGVPLPMRRSRGETPLPLALPVSCSEPILAVGGHLKSVFALSRDGRAILSQHLGDLDSLDSFRAYTEAIADFERLFRFHSTILAHDLHPDYASTRYAIERAAAERGVKLLGVQHHHAHMSSCMAENGLNEPVIGVTFDGSGYGTDGTIWGGEFLVGDYRSFHRAAHLRPVALPGGEAAIREPWRVALAHLLDAGEDADTLAERIDPADLRTVTGMIERGTHSPLASSAGRLFDAVAALIGLRDRVRYEGQAATELEGIASQSEAVGHYPFAITSLESNAPVQVDTRPLIAAIAGDVRARTQPHNIVRRFHTTLAIAIAEVCRTLREQTGLDVVVLSGGVFQNAILLTDTLDRLSRDGFRAYRHTLVPPGDGGLCLGQLVIAATAIECENPPISSH